MFNFFIILFALNLQIHKIFINFFYFFMTKILIFSIIITFFIAPTYALFIIPTLSLNIFNEIFCQILLFIIFLLIN